MGFSEPLVCILSALVCLAPFSYLRIVQSAEFSAHPFDQAVYQEAVTKDRDMLVRNLTESLTNQHLVMIGDSIMRQQYLSIVYILRNKVYSDVDHHPDNGWYEHFVHTNGQLQPYEFCDCYRDNGYNYDIYCENRYYSDPVNNISVTYLQYFGKDLFGHWYDDGDYDSFREPRKVPFKVLWRLSIQDTIRNMLTKFKHKVTLLMINFDHWEFSPHRKPFIWDHSLSDQVHEASLALLGLPLDTATAEAMPYDNINSYKFIWKTGTYAKESFEVSHDRSSINDRDLYMCSKPHVTCFNVSWTSQLPEDAYVDHIHFKEGIVDIINLQYLHDILRY